MKWITPGAHEPSMVVDRWIDYQFCQGDVGTQKALPQKCSPHTQNIQNTNRNKLVTTTKTSKLQHNKKQITIKRTICRLS